MPHLVETLIDCRAVFLNLFAVAEPSENVCVQGRSQDFSKGGAEVMEAKALKKKNCL